MKRREGEKADIGLWPHLPEPLGGLSEGAALGDKGPV